MSTRTRWKSLIVDRNGEPLTAYLHPPGTRGNTRYWSMSCRKAKVVKRSLKVTTYAEAREKALAWFRGEPRREEHQQEERSILTWEEWDAIQVAHARKRSGKNKVRAERTLEECRKAQRLFVAVTGAEAASAVDDEMVDRFQAECARRISKFGRFYSANTIRKTLAHMAASLNRCRRGSGRKCIRGVVPGEKLLASNPFEEIGWVEANEADPRHFSREELKSFFTWRFLRACPLVALFAKVSLWSCGRIEEMSELRWDWVDSDGYVSIPDDASKWGKGKMVRLPGALLDELRRYRVESPHVWAGYVDQLRAYHRSEGHGASAHKVKGFAPERLKVGFQKWLKAWAKEVKVEGVSHHAFRRTGLQWSREGQLRSSEGDYARAVNVSQGVADTHYTRRPRRIWADLTYRNIASEVAQDREFATLMGLDHPEGPGSSAPSVEAVQEALGRGDIEGAARLLSLLRN